MPKQSKIVRFPNCPKHATKHVKSIFESMTKKAEQQGWNKIIIIGKGRKSGSWHFSAMDDETALGMLEKVKLIISKDPEF